MSGPNCKTDGDLVCAYSRLQRGEDVSPPLTGDNGEYVTCLSHHTVRRPSQVYISLYTTTAAPSLSLRCSTEVLSALPGR